MLGGKAYKVEPGPVVAGDRVSSARFILLLLLLLFHPCQFDNQLFARFDFDWTTTLLLLSPVVLIALILAAQQLSSCIFCCTPVEVRISCRCQVRIEQTVCPRQSQAPLDATW
jgi:hypothetical protein